MSMTNSSAAGGESLFKLAENAAPDENRIMPAERRYLKSNKTVSVTEAISLLKQRRQHPENCIPGGLDDNSDYIRKNVNYLKINGKKQEGVSADVTIEGDSVLQKTLSFPPENAEESTLSDDSEAKKNSRGTKGVKGVKVGKTDILPILQAIQLKLGSLEKTVQAINRQETRQEQKDTGSTDYLSKLKESKHRVTFLINGMEFTVRCLSLVNDPSTNCLVLCFSEDGDTFFTPPMQSELGIRYDLEQLPGKLFYFGMNFSIRELGLRFLGFLYDRSSVREAIAL